MSVRPDGAVMALCDEVCAHLKPHLPWDLEQMEPLLEAQLIMLRDHPVAQRQAERHLLCLLVAAVMELSRGLNSIELPTTGRTCENTCGDGGLRGAVREGRLPLTGAERARRYREKKARGE